MKMKQKFTKNIFMALVLMSIQSYASIFEGIYTSNEGVQLNIFKTGDNSYLISSDHSHSNYKTEIGHEWKGTGVIDKGKYFGVFKYLDTDTKYKGLSGTHEAKFIGEKCFRLYGVINGREFGGWKFCKQ